jgi:hypothetical protein
VVKAVVVRAGRRRRWLIHPFDENAAVLIRDGGDHATPSSAPWAGSYARSGTATDHLARAGGAVMRSGQDEVRQA